MIKCLNVQDERLLFVDKFFFLLLVDDSGLLLFFCFANFFNTHSREREKDRHSFFVLPLYNVIGEGKLASFFVLDLMIFFAVFFDF